ncbi:uncharacterized protein [Palaemon carinicauda]|uniref:uncharacterized protein n=1 Tax=Palaemon carinicauda TaxID=392227 RepID=UPI0035B5BCC1
MILGLIISLMLSVITALPDTNSTYYILTDERRNLVPSKTTEVLTSILWADLSESTAVLVNIPSDIRCSFEAQRAAALAFTFEDGTCSLFGSGVGTAGHVSIYQYDLIPSDDTIEEMARRKPTTASQAHSSYSPPEDAVDGSLNDADAYFSFPLVNPWWQVDLGEERLIYQIQIFTRQIAYERFHDVEVRVGNTAIHDGNFTSFSLLCTYTKIYVLGEGHLMCSRYKGVFGRYISIQITAATAEYLQLNEVSVYGLKK